VTEGLAGQPPQPAHTHAESLDLSGLTIVGPEVMQVEVPEDEADSWDAAFSLAYERPDDFGYPWLDYATRTIRLSPATEKGRAAAEAAAAKFDPRFSVIIEDTGSSIAELDSLADALTRLNGTGLADADLIWKTEPDELYNRIVVTVGDATPGLMKGLASHFGTTTLAVRVTPVPKSGSNNRDDDSPGFWGGAKITVPAGGCTTGFGWYISSQSGMVLAGHCAPTGGSVSYPSYSNAGTISSGSEENWSTSTGTVYFPSESVYRGDVALIRYPSYASGAVVYDGAIHTSTNSPVGDMHSTWSSIGQHVCVNGAYSGEHCGVVGNVGANVWYNNDGPNVWARHVVVVDPDASCPIAGDSGAPVYKRRSDGKLTAYGVQSGTSTFLFACQFIYTDIRDVYYGVPGSLRTL
jgi:hypothetical protein